MLDEQLSAIRNSVAGARAVLLVGLDGIVVACSPAEGVRGWEAAAAAYADLFGRARQAQEVADLGPPEELVVGSASEFAVMRAIQNDYLVLTIVARDGGLGRARFEMRRRASAILDAL